VKKLPRNITFLTGLQGSFKTTYLADIENARPRDVIHWREDDHYMVNKLRGRCTGTVVLVEDSAEFDEVLAVARHYPEHRFLMAIQLHQLVEELNK
jgi:hypothetical protein